MLEALFGLHLDREEVISILLEFASGSELIVEGLPNFLEFSKRVAQKRIETVGGNALEAGEEHSAHEEVVRINHHLILVVPKMLDGVGRFGLEVKARHHELPRETVGHDSRRKRGAGNSQIPRLHLVARLPARFFDAFLNQLGNVFDIRNLRGLV